MRLKQASGLKQTDAGGTPITYTAAANFQTGSTVIFEFVRFSSTITGITVSGTAAVLDKSFDAGSGNTVECWRASNVAGGNANVVVTLSGAGAYISGSFEEWFGFQASPLDKTAQTTNTSGTSPTVTAGSANAQADTLEYAAFIDFAGTNWTSSTPPTGWTETFEEHDGGAHEAGAGAYKLARAVETASAVFTTGATVNYAAILATYKVWGAGHGIKIVNGAGASSQSTNAFDTAASGGTMVAFVGRGVLADHASNSITDNKSNTYTQLGTAHAYTAWTTSGTAVYYKTSASGGSGHVVTAAVPTTSDEVSLIGIEVPGVTSIVDSAWNEDLTTSTNTSSSVTTTGAATLVLFWAGDHSNGELNPDAGSNWTKVEWSSSVAGNHVQVAAFIRTVTGAGTYNAVVTPSLAQGAQMWIIALQAGGGGGGSTVPINLLTTRQTSFNPGR